MATRSLRFFLAIFKPTKKASICRVITSQSKYRFRAFDRGPSLQEKYADDSGTRLSQASWRESTRSGQAADVAMQSPSPIEGEQGELRCKRH
jgi:hypothetical protein